MNSLEKKIRSVLVKTVPLPSDTARDWEDVVRRSEAPGEAADAVRARRSRRSYLAGRLVPVFVLAAVALVIGMIVPWQHGPGSTVMGRALAAVGDKPVLHVVFRDHVAAGSYVNLATGQETPIIDTTEIWADKERNYEHVTQSAEASGVFASVVFSEALSTPESTLSSNGHVLPGRQLGLALWMDGFFDNYTSALEDGTAHVTGTGTVDGHDVTWIELRPKDSLCFDSSGPCKERVAIDNASSLPIRAVWFQMHNISEDMIEIATIETLPAGSGDFSKPEKIEAPKVAALMKALSVTLVWGVNTNQASNMGAYPTIREITPTDSSGAAKTLPGAVWVGKSISSLPLTGVSEATASSPDRSGGSAPIVQTGIELHYGDGQATALWSKTHSEEDPSGDGVVIHEQKASLDWSFWPDPSHPAPAGSMVISGSGREGWLEKNGSYVLIVAPNRVLLLEVARALEPIKP